MRATSLDDGPGQPPKTPAVQPRIYVGTRDQAVSAFSFDTGNHVAPAPTSGDGSDGSDGYGISFS